MFTVERIRARISFEEIGKVKAIFKEYDKDANGSMDAHELAVCLRKLGVVIPSDYIPKLVEKMDEDGTGKIELGEFIDWYPTFVSLAKRATTRVRDNTAGIDWHRISRLLPSSRDPEDKQRRMQMFDQFDPNGNGYLSLAEVDKGLRDIGLHEVFDCKPVIMRAFQAAKNVNTKRPSKYGPDYIERCEFRLLLLYLRQYFEMWQMFDLTDTSDDRRIDANEFAALQDRFRSWGLKTTKSPTALFNEIDVNGGGYILFDEFAAWALRLKLDLENDDDD